jgi:hypothetical protein
VTAEAAGDRGVSSDYGTSQGALTAGFDPGIRRPYQTGTGCPWLCGVNRQYGDEPEVPNGYCPIHATGVKHPDDFVVTPLQYVE